MPYLHPVSSWATRARKRFSKKKRTVSWNASQGQTAEEHWGEHLKMDVIIRQPTATSNQREPGWIMHSITAFNGSSPPQLPVRPEVEAQLAPTGSYAWRAGIFFYTMAVVMGMGVRRPDCEQALLGCSRKLGRNKNEMPRSSWIWMGCRVHHDKNRMSRSSS